MARGKYPARKQVPFVMGFEAAGTVVETGAGANGVKVGDRITAIVSSGGLRRIRCRRCRHGDSDSAQSVLS